VRPILISQGTVMPFVLVFLGLLGGLWAFGFIGVFLGPTLLAIGFSLVQEFVRGGVARGAPQAPGGNAAEEGHAETPASSRG
jgi:predicted PurR-regulated permease PerM